MELYRWICKRRDASYLLGLPILSQPYLCQFSMSIARNHASLNSCHCFQVKSNASLEWNLRNVDNNILYHISYIICKHCLTESMEQELKSCLFILSYDIQFSKLYCIIFLSRSSFPSSTSLSLIWWSPTQAWHLYQVRCRRSMRFVSDNMLRIFLIYFLKTSSRVIWLIYLLHASKIM